MTSADSPTHTYRVYVDDNFHYMDATERYFLGEFASCAEAIVACKKIVDEWLTKEYSSGKTSEDLWRLYASFGEDPWIATTDKDCGSARFSTWNYAKERCIELAG